MTIVANPGKVACGVYSNVLAEGSHTLRGRNNEPGETFPAQGPVKTKILGERDS